jgi:hypothetical protein
MHTLSVYQPTEHTTGNPNAQAAPAGRARRAAARGTLLRATGPIFFTAVVSVYLAQALVARAASPANINDG